MADCIDLVNVSKRLADEGKLIETGWIGLRLTTISLNAPAGQLDDMRMAFMAGAQHLFACITTILDPGADPTVADLRRMDLIHKELGEFDKELRLKVERPQGSA